MGELGLWLVELRLWWRGGTGDVGMAAGAVGSCIGHCGCLLGLLLAACVETLGLVFEGSPWAGGEALRRGGLGREWHVGRHICSLCRVVQRAGRR